MGTRNLLYAAHALNAIFLFVWTRRKRKPVGVPPTLPALAQMTILSGYAQARSIKMGPSMSVPMWTVSHQYEPVVIRFWVFTVIFFFVDSISRRSSNIMTDDRVCALLNDSPFARQESQDPIV